MFINILIAVGIIFSSLLAISSGVYVLLSFMADRAAKYDEIFKKP